MSVQAKLAELSITLPPPPKPVATYIPSTRVGNMIYTSGQLPTVAGVMQHPGKLGGNVTIEQGQEAARVCVLNALAIVADVAGSLDSVVRIVKMTCYVASGSGFTDQPKVANGASDLLGKIFGEAGRHARAAVGVAELPLGAAVELDLIVEVK